MVCVERSALLVILILGVVDNVEELELVDTLRGRDNTKPVAELLLLEELLGPASQSGMLSASEGFPGALVSFEGRAAAYRYFR